MVSTTHPLQRALQQSNAARSSACAGESVFSSLEGDGHGKKAQERGKCFGDGFSSRSQFSTEEEWTFPLAAAIPRHLGAAQTAPKRGEGGKGSIRQSETAVSGQE